ncbi:septal ring lytic transglycosylase RlpA family protein [Tepidamorphus sp. 3E244]|uniref:septal ring lytic transglycosylase RlpA family protein n=1 Tax=Tepidamorphus sp. 3E244 TaxID=3385498 RepID=UPI0038FC64FA
MQHDHSSIDQPRQGVALKAVAVTAMALVLSACGSLREESRFDSKLGVSSSQRVVAAGKPVPKGGGVYKVGKPYKVAGRWYYPREDTAYQAVGTASWYGDAFHGRQTANGEVFDMNALTAAHPTLPLPTYARVTNLTNNRSVVVRVNDRGPYAHDRLIDLSSRTARVLGFDQQGTTQVKVEYVGRAPLDGDDSWLSTTYAEAGQALPMPDSQFASDDKARKSLRPQNVVSQAPTPSGDPGSLLSSYTPTWATMPNRVAEAFGAIDAAEVARNGVSKDLEAYILNDPSVVDGR